MQKERDVIVTNNKELVELVKDPKRFVSRTAGFYFLFLSFLWIPSGIIMYVLKNILSESMFYIVGNLLAPCLMFLILICILQGFSLWGVMGFKLPDLMDVFFAFIITISAYPAMCVLGYVGEHMFPTVQDALSTSEASVLTGMGPAVCFLLLAVVPATIEELVCRGFLYGVYRERNTVVAIFVTALCFGLLHFNIRQFLYAFVFGLVLGCVRETTGSVIPCIFSHGAFNTIGVIQMFQESVDIGFSYTGSDPNMASYIIMTIVSILAVIILLIACMKYSGRQINAKTHKEYHILSVPLFIGWIVCFAVMFIMI